MYTWKLTLYLFSLKASSALSIAILRFMRDLSEPKVSEEVNAVLYFPFFDGGGYYFVSFRRF